MALWRRALLLSASLASCCAGCTGEGGDPWATGKNVACCAGLESVLKDWNGDGHQSYRCINNSPSPSPWPTTTSTPAPESGHEVAEWMNRLYKGFNAKDDTSPLGVTISMQNEWAVYCKEAGGTCYQGHADCRLSASLYNSQMMLQRGANSIKMTMDRVAGIVFNQSLVEKRLGKCSYMFDGASFNRYNGGCGCVAGATSCSDPHSAYGNVCTSTGRTCEVADKEVAQCWCQNMPEPSRSDVPQCYWKGASMDRMNAKAHDDQTRNMVKARLRHQDGVDSNDRLEYWNEVVIDEILMLEELRKDPIPVIPAFVYVRNNAAGIDYARKIRSEYMQAYAVQRLVPLIAVDDDVDVAKGNPFVYEKEVSDHSTTLVEVV